MKVAYRKRGFTLIEIVLVLAISGLIFVILFFALFGATRERRDLQRKRDVTELMAFSIDYSANNAGIAAASQAQVDVIRSAYFANREDPQKQIPYDILFRAISEPHTAMPPLGTIFYQQGHWCNRGPESMPDNSTDPIAGNDVDPGKMVVWTPLETGGVACADNK